MKILSKNNLRDICESLDLPISGNKEKLIENIHTKNKNFKTLLMLLSKKSIQEICSKLNLTIIGNKNE